MSEYPAERKYWTDESEQEQRVRVQMTIIKRLINNPILKKRLTLIEELRDLSILKQFQGTNFPVKNKEWRIISKFV